jgi:nitrate/nitrite-specific signal transduction histidine kinase
VADLAETIEQLALRSQGSPAQESSGRNMQALLAETVNETTNRLNGIMNYAQLLYDSSDQMQMKEEQKSMLRKIMDGGVDIAHEWQKIK